MRRLVVNFVVDASSSMEVRRKQVIESYNEYLDTVAKEPHEVRVARTHFDDGVVVKHPVVPLAAAPRLSFDDYYTQGSTALWDGIGTTIRRLEREVRAEDRVTVVVLTDGHENMSKDWDLPTLAALIKQKTATGLWTFVMLGADLFDVEEMAEEMGFLPGNILGFEGGSEGIRAAFAKVIEGTQRLLTDGSGSSRTFFSQ